MSDGVAHGGRGEHFVGAFFQLIGGGCGGGGGEGGGGEVGAVWWR